MSIVLKIMLICVMTQWCKTEETKLLEGLDWLKEFEINFELWPIKPITFIKKKWSPFRSVEKKITIKKRSLDDIMPVRPAAPVFEEVEEDPMGTAPILIVPKAPVLAYAPIVSPQESFAGHLPKPMPIIVNEYPPSTGKPIIVPSISSNMVETQAIQKVNRDVSSVEFFTDISRVESIKKYMEAIEHLHSESPKPLPEPIIPPVFVTSIAPILSPQKPLLENSVLLPPLPPPPPSKPLLSSPPLSLPPPLVPSPVHPLQSPPPPPLKPLLSPPPISVPPPLAPSPVPLLPSLPISSTVPVSVEIISSTKPIPILIKEETKEEPPPPLAQPPHSPPPPPPSLPPPLPPSPPPVKHDVPKTVIERKEHKLVKGSKMALRFGTAFLTLMAQFFDKARTSIDHIMTNPLADTEH